MQNVHMQIAIIIDYRLGIGYFIEKHLNHKIQFTM